MAGRRNKYPAFEKTVSRALIMGAVVFIIYLIAAGNGVAWLKILAAVIDFLVGFGVLALLFLSKELLRPRSIWMTVGALAIIACLLVSLIVKYPSPNPYKNVPTVTVTTPTE